MSYPASHALHGASTIETSSRGAEQSAAAPHLALDLLARLTKRGVPRLAAFKSQIGRVAAILRKSSITLTIDDLYETKPWFRKALENRKYAENSIQAFVNDLATLLRYAEDMGWSPWAEIPPAWLPIFDAAKEKRCRTICRYAAGHGKQPSDITQDDVDQWVLERVQFRAWDPTQAEANRFVKLLASFGAWTKLGARKQDDFGIPLRDMPESLRSEINNLLAWKTSLMARGRQRKQKIREVSAKHIKGTFSLLYGHAINIAGISPTSIPELVSEDLTYAFSVWYLGERGVAGKSAQVRLSSILALFHQHPNYQEHDMTWFKELIDTLPLESETDVQERRAAKQVPLASVRSIPELIRQTRTTAAKKSAKKLAWVVQLELIMLWLTVCPWRQRNLRECRVGGASPNLFKGSLRNTPNLAKPDWVADILADDPDAEFWQVRFAAEGDLKPGETKNGRGIHVLLPRPLVPLLEEYLYEHRPVLLGSMKTEELFLNTNGKRLSGGRLCSIVGEQTLRLIRKRVTPHTFRHIVAYAFLEKFPKDFLTLSKILWHKNVLVTINIYGGTYNESNGTCAMERWMEDESGQG